LKTIVILLTACQDSLYFLMTISNLSHTRLMTPYGMDFLEEERMVVLHGNSLVVAQEDMELHTVGDNREVEVQVFLPYSEEGNSVHWVHHNGLVDLGGARVAFGDNVVVEEEVRDSGRAGHHCNSAVVVVDMVQMTVVVPVVHHAFHAVGDKAPFPEEAGDRMGTLRACSVAVVRGVEMGATYPNSCFFATEKAWFAIFSLFARNDLHSRSLSHLLHLFVIYCPNHRGFRPLPQTLVLMICRVLVRSVCSL
jgi:hypothetical protein